MLKITVLDVGHGDSIVLENPQTGQFAVIDCHTNLSRGDAVPRAYSYLKNAGVKELDAVVVTHLHQDHFTGIEALLNDFSVKRLLIPPFLSRNDRLHNAVIKKTVEKIKQVVRSSSDPYVVRPSMSMAHLLNFITNNESIVEEATGPSNSRRICGFDVTIQLPLPRIKGRLHHVLSTSDACLDTFPEMNDSSIALSLRYGGREVLLSGDSTVGQWDEHKRQRARDGITSLGTRILKVAHHGSRHNNTEQLYSYLLDAGDINAIAIVSANGRTHPHDEYFRLVERHKLVPYCTGLAEQCKPKNVQRLTQLNRIPKDARIFLDALNTEGPSVSCQGDIAVTISSTGEILVTPSLDRPCIYRLGGPSMA